VFRRSLRDLSVAHVPKHCWAGYIQSIGEAFDKYIGQRLSAYFSRYNSAFRRTSPDQKRQCLPSEGLSDHHTGLDELRNGCLNYRRGLGWTRKLLLRSYTREQVPNYTNLPTNSPDPTVGTDFHCRYSSHPTGRAVLYPFEAVKRLKAEA